MLPQFKREYIEAMATRMDYRLFKLNHVSVTPAIRVQYYLTDPDAFTTLSERVLNALAGVLVLSASLLTNVSSDALCCCCCIVLWARVLKGVPIVTPGQICNFRDPNLTTLYLCMYLILTKEHFTFHLQYKHSSTFANRKYEELSCPKNQKICDPF